MRRHTRAFAALSITALGLLGLGATNAPPADALSPCRSAPMPPDWCFSPPAAPVAPTGLSATAVMQTRVSLTWADNSGSESAYFVRRTVGGVVGQPVALAANSTAYTDPGAPPDSVIQYDVYADACNIYGCTDSRVASRTVRTKPQPATPELSVSGGQDGYWYYKSWSYPFNRVWVTLPSYTITGTAVDWDTTGAVQLVLTDNGVQQDDAGTAAGMSAGFNAANPGYGDNHGFTIHRAALPAEGTHYACVTARGVGAGGDSPTKCVTYFVEGAPYWPVLTQTADRVSVAFTDMNDHETGYILQRQDAAGWIQAASMGPVAGHGTRQSLAVSDSVPSGVCYRVLMNYSTMQGNSYSMTSSTVCTKG
ncbi:hypothetical protein [Leekyejoonella antrihumi]|uniref:Fibronectin type-III domain-containing protein n=1 Tax=Leekyejoonella antrihumi TaxID=1660198 RepID=A0A563E1E9_9MICO|nr:hypothetical protein [Leekyejoonella antrihumi]TWP35724.1 hypothetical protein FGL98_13015 [Leekyejoonella antrihumi]